MKNISLLLLIALITSACGDDEKSKPSSDYNLLVSNSGTSAVFKFNGETGEFIDDFIPTATGGLRDTQELLIGQDGQLLVSGFGNAEVKKYNLQTGEFISNFTSGFSLQSPAKMAFGPDGHLYVSQWGSNSSSVVKFDGSTGQFIEEVTPNLDRPMGQAWRDGKLYVANFGSRDVHEYLDGELQQILIPAGILQGPVNLQFESNGDILVEDWQDGKMKRFSSDGTFQGIYITGLSKLEGTGIGPDGSFYACDWETGVVRKYDAQTGQSIGVFTSGVTLTKPNSLLFVMNVED